MTQQGGAGGELDGDCVWPPCQAQIDLGLGMINRKLDARDVGTAGVIGEVGPEANVVCTEEGFKI